MVASNQGANPSKKWFKMKGMFWNGNGFRDPKKHKFVSNLMKENNLNFIAISETGRSDFTPRFLKNLCSGRDYLWHCKPPNGRSGGMLLGIDLQYFDIGSIDEGDHYIKFHLSNKADEFKWVLVMVYGPVQDDRKENFLAELVHTCSHENLSLLIGGDYNILRHPSEKIMIASMVDGHSRLMPSLTVLTSRS
jgi:exonuclease III